jgi:hypothetical protein
MPRPLPLHSKTGPPPHSKSMASGPAVGRRHAACGHPFTTSFRPCRGQHSCGANRPSRQTTVLLVVRLIGVGLTGRPVAVSPCHHGAARVSQVVERRRLSRTRPAVELSTRSVKSHLIGLPRLNSKSRRTSSNRCSDQERHPSGRTSDRFAASSSWPVMRTGRTASSIRLKPRLALPQTTPRPDAGLKPVGCGHQTSGRPPFAVVALA